MMRWTPRTTLTRRTLLACSLLLAVLACGALPGVSDAATRKLRGPGFSTLLPKSWKIYRGNDGNARLYRAFSPKTKPNVTLNSMQLGVNVTSVKSVERQLGRRLPSSPEELLGIVVGAPQGAQGTQVVVPTRSTTLDGMPAAAAAVQYSLGGVAVLQSDTLSIYHGRIYVIELEIDANLQFQALPVLAKARSTWRWH